jgi:hypothetical protein
MIACFWCDATPLEAGALTRDHVRPRAFGGVTPGNVVPACLDCNSERGHIVGFALEVAKLKKTLAPPQNTVNKLCRRSSEVHALRDKWVAIENTRWGESPTGDLDLNPPGTPGPSAASPRTRKIRKRKKRHKKRMRVAERQAAGELSHRLRLADLSARKRLAAIITQGRKNPPAPGDSACPTPAEPTA